MKDYQKKLALSVIEMGKALGISRSTAYALSRRADFPTARIGQRIVIPVDALQDWLNRGGTNGTDAV